MTFDFGLPQLGYTPAHIIQRRPAVWCGLRAETIELIESQPYEYDFKAPIHLLIMAERSERYDGETCLEGLPRSRLRELSRRMTFVPAGRCFRGWQKPRVMTRVNLFYIDPRGPFLDPELGFEGIEFQPRLFFSIRISGQPRSSSRHRSPRRTPSQALMRRHSVRFCVRN